MMPGGKGGANTKTGIHFEKKTDLLTAIGKLPGFSIRHITHKGKVRGGEVLKGNKVVAISCGKHDLYRFLKDRGVDYKTLISSKLLPDEALYVPSEKKMHIIEKKFQKTPGSVDEKLQTSAFKKQQYTKLFKSLDIQVEYSYVLNDWFNMGKYRDVLVYVNSVGCSYYFGFVPLSKLGLSTEGKYD